MRFVGQPIQQGRGKVGIAKNLGPVAEPEITGNDHRTLFMAFSQDLEEQLGCPIHLFLFVKVREGWTDDPERYAPWGLDFNA